MYCQFNLVKAPTGTTGNNVMLWLPAGRTVIRRVAAQNSTNGGQPITLALAAIGAVDPTAPVKIASLTGDHLPLNVSQQMSPAEWVIWEGRIECPDQYPYVVAQFNDAVDTEDLALKVLYE